jgi:hypothetical protein
MSAHQFGRREFYKPKSCVAILVSPRLRGALPRKCYVDQSTKLRAAVAMTNA